MNNYYRITYKNIGIYEALKKELWKISEFPGEEWNKIKDSNAVTWLKRPTFYSDKCLSYFTQLGYDKFMNKTYDLFKKYLDEDKINIKVYQLDINNINILYEDEYQIVIESNL